uniref:Uncharacterized protein n=1 Tax=Oryza rufipogon TaxID=4529 RepID=A0A0E0QIR1_ORYRU
MAHQELAALQDQQHHEFRAARARRARRELRRRRHAAAVVRLEAEPHGAVAAAAGRGLQVLFSTDPSPWIQLKPAHTSTRNQSTATNRSNAMHKSQWRWSRSPPPPAAAAALQRRHRSHGAELGQVRTTDAAAALAAARCRHASVRHNAPVRRASPSPAVRPWRSAAAFSAARRAIPAQAVAPFLRSAACVRKKRIGERCGLHL